MRLLPICHIRALWKPTKNFQTRLLLLSLQTDYFFIISSRDPSDSMLFIHPFICSSVDPFYSLYVPFPLSPLTHQPKNVHHIQPYFVRPFIILFLAFVESLVRPFGHLSIGLSVHPPTRLPISSPTKRSNLCFLTEQSVFETIHYLYIEVWAPRKFIRRTRRRLTEPARMTQDT